MPCRPVCANMLAKVAGINKSHITAKSIKHAPALHVAGLSASSVSNVLADNSISIAENKGIRTLAAVAPNHPRRGQPPLFKRLFPVLVGGVEKPY